MSRLDAPFVSAKVVDGQPLRDRTYRQFVGHPMGHRCLSSGQPELAIASRVTGTAPLPTVATLVDLCPKTFGDSRHGPIVASQNYDGDPIVADNFHPYGGWTRCVVKQYHGTTDIGAVHELDLDSGAPTL